MAGRAAWLGPPHPSHACHTTCHHVLHTFTRMDRGARLVRCTHTQYVAFAMLTYRLLRGFPATLTSRSSCSALGRGHVQLPCTHFGCFDQPADSSDQNSSSHIHNLAALPATNSGTATIYHDVISRTNK
eukprot:365526-Chlamydomonas_euryale.AAC.8